MIAQPRISGSNVTILITKWRKRIHFRLDTVPGRERFFLDNLLVRIHHIVQMS